MHFYNKYLSGQWTDSRIILDDGRKFDVHKIVLSTVPYFDRYAISLTLNFVQLFEKLNLYYRQ